MGTWSLAPAVVPSALAVSMLKLPLTECFSGRLLTSAISHRDTHHLLGNLMTFRTLSDALIDIPLSAGGYISLRLGSALCGSAAFLCWGRART